MRIGPNELVANDSTVLKRMSAVRSSYRRSAWYDGTRLEREYDSTFSETNEGRHTRNALRSKLAIGVSYLATAVPESGNAHHPTTIIQNKQSSDKLWAEYSQITHVFSLKIWCINYYFR